jgi:hypothetical protein
MGRARFKSGGFVENGIANNDGLACCVIYFDGYGLIEHKAREAGKRR